MKRQAKTNKENKKRPSSAHPSKIPRTNVLYWRNKVEKTTSQNGAVNSSYSVRIEWRKRRVRFPLDTPNKNSASSKALQIFKFLMGNDWDATLEKYKPHTIKEEPEESPLGKTVGDLIQSNQKYSSARVQTLQAYIKAFRRLVSGIMEQVSPKFESHQDCGLDAWRDQVDLVLLTELTPTRIQNWKQCYLKEHSKTSTTKKKAITTVNSIIRNSKALISKKLLPFLEQEIELPTPLPFEGVTMEKPPSSRYHSKIDAKTILKLAHQNLKDQEPESYKMILLALVCGLRVSEIDYLLWDAFDFSTGLLIIEDTEYHQLKSEDSAGEIALSEDMKRIFKDFQKQASGEFVIESRGTLDRSKTTRSYRCRGAIETLKKWLRANGVHAQKPIHELRKEIGSIIASEEGIFASSRYLRHSDIRITSSIYADQKNRVVPSIGNNLLS